MVKNAPFFGTEGLSQPLTVDRACVMSPGHFQGARFELFFLEALQKTSPTIIEAL
jgi:hypothetical protein